MKTRGTLLLPKEYLSLEDVECAERIRAKREEIGKRMVLLAHHYQRDEIVAFADFIGDSFYLARMASLQEEAEFIVFCGVHFMAESADILSSDGQVVVHPDLTAGCPMADMADILEVEEAWNAIGEAGRSSFIPVTYINSDAELKAFCGRRGGTVCTSSNAPAVFDWVMGQKKRIFFFPDEHLGKNTALKKGFGEDSIIVWDPGEELGGNSQEDIDGADVIVWKGYCHVHTWFKPQHVLDARRRHPEARIVVHPECVSDVVSMADAAGSTEYIIKYVKDSPPGSTIYIGTEIHLVNRLIKNSPGKRILPLAQSLCPNMYKISLNDLLWTLDNLGEINVVEVPPETKKDARIALERMLDIT